MKKQPRAETIPDYSKYKPTKPLLTEILLDLLDICQQRHIGVEFELNEVSQWGGILEGKFDACCSRITVFKPLAEKFISLKTLWILAHEVRHSEQFATKTKPQAWFYYLGLILKEPTKDCEWLEDDADDWATKFIAKYINN